jgi:hypothetical protein
MIYLLLNEEVNIVVPSLNIVTLSSAELEYRAMAHTSSKMLWVCSLLQGIGVDVLLLYRCIVTNRPQSLLLTIMISMSTPKI